MNLNPKNRFDQLSSESTPQNVVAKIGPNGLEWDSETNHALHSEEADPTSTARMEAMEAIRRVEALNAIEREMSQRHIMMNEEEILSKIAARRGAGSLHSDLGLG